MTSRTGFVSHEYYFWHHTGASAGPMPYNLVIQPDAHPESPATKRRFLGLLEVSGLLAKLDRIEPRVATEEELRYFHTPEYIARIEQMSNGIGGDAGEREAVLAGELRDGGPVALVARIQELHRDRPLERRDDRGHRGP